MRQLVLRAGCFLLIGGIACRSAPEPARYLGAKRPDSTLQRQRGSLARMTDSMRREFIEERLHRGVVEPEGPALIAFYPAPFRAPVMGDSDLSRAIVQFRDRIPRARELAHGLGWEYWERYGSTIRIADRRGLIAKEVGLPALGFGFVVLVPGYPPRMVPGIGADSALTRAMDQYLTELKSLGEPNRAGI